MHLGLSAASHTSLDPRSGADHLLARVDAAVTAELDSLSFGDHHVVAGDSYFQNVPTLARALAHWPDRPAGCLFLLPLWNPVLVAEQVGTLAAFHPGPFLLQTGLGGGEQQFRGMGTRLGERGATFEESLRIVRALLDGDTVSSERFDIDGARIGLRPPGPVEWWVGASAAAGLRRAARVGDAWYTSPQVTVDSLAEPDRIYREACDDLDRPPRVIVRKDMLIAGTAADRTATREAVESGRYRGMTLEQVVVADSAEEAADRLAPFAAMGVDQVVARTMGISTAADLATIEALGTVRRLLA